MPQNAGCVPCHLSVRANSDPLTRLFGSVGARRKIGEPNAPPVGGAAMGFPDCEA
jgi:hypothetical protein